VHTRILIAAAALLALSALLPAEAAAADLMLPDRIILTTGDQVSGVKVTYADVTGVTYVKFPDGEESTKLAVSQIAEISWGDTPGDFRRALSDFRKGEWKAALDNLANTPETGPRVFWYEPYRQLLWGQCLLEQGKYAEALPKFTDVMRRHSRSLYFLEAVESSARAQMELGHYKDVAETYARLDPTNSYDRVDSPEPYGKLWQLRGRIGAADALVRVPGRAGEAAGIYAKLAEVAKAILQEPPAGLKHAQSEIAVIRQRALIGKAEVLKSSGKVAEAIAYIDSISDEITDDRARVGMYMTRGNIGMQVAEKAPADQQALMYKQVMLAYMRVYILYPQFKNVRPRAMLGAAGAFVKMNTPLDKGYAIRICKEVVTEYPESDEAKEASRMLEGWGVK